MRAADAAGGRRNVLTMEHGMNLPLSRYGLFLALGLP